MSDLISRQEAISLPVMPKKYRKYQTYNLDDAYEQGWEDLQKCIEKLPSAQQQRILYANMSDAEFEKWLYEHGICNPNIHESIPCDAVPLLIDNAISELPSAQPERKTGKLLYHHTENIDEVKTADVYFCSFCKKEVLKKIRFGMFSGELDIQYDYCPSCGAKMEVEYEHCSN